VVFAKAPRAGRVKTRLAADIGEDEAVRIYRHLGRSTVDALRGGPHRLIVYHDPPGPDSESEMISWLGRRGLEFRPQVGGDLGERMERAFDECFADAEQVCIVGTDVPGLGSESVGAAFRALDAHDAVLGPATDGGYYLLALRRPRPELFERIPWSSSAVREITLDRLAACGATVHILEAKTDVDVGADVPRRLRRGA
jgi:rSAM/selenodomain-associated transferase 1